MKKTITLILQIICLLIFKVNAQTTIHAVGAVDVCNGTVLLEVVNPKPGSTYDWYIGGYGCLNPTQQAPYAFGTQCITYTTGEFFCIETTSGGMQQISNPIIVRNLPGSAGSILMPAPGLNSGTTTCVSSVSLCVPYVYYSNWSGTIIKWYKDNVLISGASSASYTATATGYYKYTVTSGCLTAWSDSTLVTVLPTVQISTSSTSPVCPGQNITFNIVSPVPGYTFTWQRVINGSYVDVTTGTSYSFNAPSTGSATVRAKTTVGACTGYSSLVTLQVQVINASLSPSGTVSICSGDSVVLAASPSSGYSYQWKKNGAVVGGAISNSYSLKDSGTYNVIISSTACSATSPTTTVKVNALPTSAITAQGSLTFCSGDSVVLEANAGLGLTYKWTKSSIVILGATASAYSAKISGNYKVIVTNSSGCSKISAVKKVVVNSLPVATITPAGPTSFCAGDSVKLQSNVVSGATYDWKKGANLISGAIKNFYYAKTAGNYRVLVTNSNGCSKLSSATSVSVPCKTLNTIDPESPVFSVNPNPSNDYFTLTGFDFENENYEIELFDASGRNVAFDSEKISKNELRVLIAQPGFYFASVKSGTHSGFIRLIKN